MITSVKQHISLEVVILWTQMFILLLTCFKHLPAFKIHFNLSIDLML